MYLKTGNKGTNIKKAILIAIFFFNLDFSFSNVIIAQSTIKSTYYS